MANKLRCPLRKFVVEEKIQNDYEKEKNLPGRCATVALHEGLGAVELELTRLVHR